MNRLLTFFLIASALLLAEHAAPAWDNAGHMTAAAIAYEKCSAQTKSQIDRLLIQHPDYRQWSAQLGVPAGSRAAGITVFMMASVWPDAIKHDPRFYDSRSASPTPLLPGFPSMLKHAEWHYIDQPLCTDGSVDIHTLPDNWRRENVVVEIKEMERKLTAASETESFLACDLCFLSHLVGDIHQPLHCVTRYTRKDRPPGGDLGGNRFLIADPAQKLHTFWDLLPGDSNDPEQALRQAHRLERLKMPHGAGDLNVDHWAAESYGIAEDFAYTLGKDEPGDPAPPVPAVYRRRAAAIADQRLLLAGVRLAAVLNTVFAHQKPEKTTVPETHTYTILLNHVGGDEIIGTMHWDRPQNLPDGVTKIETNSGEHFLRAVTTLAGLKSITEVVRQLDAAPRRVELAAAIATVTDQNLQAFATTASPQAPAVTPNNYRSVIFIGSKAEHLYGQLDAIPNKIVIRPSQTTPNNATRIFTFPPIRQAAVDMLAEDRFQPLLAGSVVVTVSPRINSDQTITLILVTDLTESGEHLETCVTVPNNTRLALNGLTPPDNPHAEIFVFLKAAILPN